MIAEAWDAAGLYQVGSFVGDSWREWNGRFRDDVRRFFCSEDRSLRHFADRLLGSSEIYGCENREAEQSVNFVACHDGFTLNDLVSYDRKHNEANGEGNRDGADDNFSWNCGVEGPTNDPAIEKLRNRQVKNFLTVTLLSLGMPMITMGDEVRRTQHGNNNAYSHNDLSVWFDWTFLEKHADVHRFTRLLIQRRLLRDMGPERQRMTLAQLISRGIRGWHGVKLDQPDWSDYSHSVALSVELPEEHLLVYFIFNAYWEQLEFELPVVANDSTFWHRWVDTHLDSPQDIVEWKRAPALLDRTYKAGPRSIVVLWASHGATDSS
jgi:glycogen operon protein